MVGALPGTSWALLRSSHPGPTLVVTVVAVLLAVGAGLEPWRVVLIGVATALDQLSVGLSNDWIDEARDRATGRRDKPVARGEVGIRVVRAAAISTAVAALLVTIPLGWAAVAAHVVMLGSAWSYNAGLKRTAFSVLPFIVSFGLVPAFVTLSLPTPSLPAWWATTAGALLGIAAHVANVLPDVDDDRRTGISGLPHRIPRGVALASTWVALLGAAVAIASGIGLGSPLAIAALIVTGAIAAVGISLDLRRSTRWGFRLVLLAAVIDVALLVLAGGRIVAS
jgi:4-hydroxybenzoate polyprenyltransferase